MRTCSVYHWNQSRNKVENKCQLIAVEVFIYQSIWLWSFVCLCKIQNMSKNGNKSIASVFLHQFLVPIFWSIKKLILECGSIWQSMRKFLWAVWSVSTFPHMDKEETFLSWKLHIDMVWIFYTFSLDLKI